MREKRQSLGRSRRPAAPTSWDALARWYDGWVGEGGSEYHRELAVPAVLRLLDLKPGERVLDVGAGQGVLAPFAARAGAQYTGIDASPRLLEIARQRHGKAGRFLLGDARRLLTLPGIQPDQFDAVVFLLSIQDMDPLEPVLQGAADVLKLGGRIVILLTHPAFRVPRQSGWGFDEGRKLIYRRVDRYLTPLPVPMKAYPGVEGTSRTRSFHRPLQDYVNGMACHGLLIDRMDEIPAHKLVTAPANKRAENLARQEIPLFMGLRARKLGHCLNEDTG
ncbi:MAG: class I SAM-dependent methyltransferase [Chloroflexota bacterium]|nr:class I SAM-dependent methyltransferase [Chloroflexota bacterium]